MRPSSTTFKASCHVIARCCYQLLRVLLHLWSAPAESDSGCDIVAVKLAKDLGTGNNPFLFGDLWQEDEESQ